MKSVAALDVAGSVVGIEVAVAKEQQTNNHYIEQFSNVLPKKYSRVPKEVKVAALDVAESVVGIEVAVAKEQQTNNHYIERFSNVLPKKYSRVPKEVKVTALDVAGSVVGREVVVTKAQKSWIITFSNFQIKNTVPCTVVDY